MERNNKFIGKREFILISVILIFALVFFLWNRSNNSSPAASVEVSIIHDNSEKEVLASLDLNQDTEYIIQTEGGGINHLVIKNKCVQISEANCPNHDCIKKGTISQTGEMIICIPHRLTVSILGN